VNGDAELSPEQQSFVEAEGGIYVEACPGAGKTRAIVARFMKRAGEEPRKGIALLSFTNAAVEEVRERCGGNSRLLLAPNYVGTFDGFINRYISAPAFRRWKGVEPRFLESWDVLDRTRIQVAGMEPKWLDFSLEWFDVDAEQQASLVDARIGGKYAAKLRQLAVEHRAALDTAASKRHVSFVSQGLLSSSASRWLARRTLASDQGPISTALLRDRFAEVIVDEGQDCGAEELAILSTLHEAGVSIVMVADLDQAIFEFRRASPDAVRDFGASLPVGERLAGNYRSTPVIVKLVDSLRAGGETDTAVGSLATTTTPIQLLRFKDASTLPDAIRATAESEGFSAADVMVIAHRRSDALMAAGRRPDGDVGSRKVAIIADAALVLKSPTAAPKERRRAIESVERVILALCPSVAIETTPTDAACEELAVPRGWLRESAIRIASGRDPRVTSRADYASAIREHVRALKWPAEHALAGIADQLKAPPENKWTDLLGVPDRQDLAADTVHGVKGREFPAVAVVIPKSLRTDDDDRTSLDCWQEGVDSEARRVLYVGVSRAQRLAILAVHEKHVEQVQNLLDVAGVAYIATDSVIAAGT